MRFHFSCTRNPHTEREVYTMRTPRLRLLSAILAVALFFTLLPVSALASTTTFSPGQTCTRAQIVTFLWRDMA